uniref:Uncharacterized shell protein 3 n=1 Tax=Margaritifera margaritifera TaxID=102329 RepID=USP3_PINMG|nr:RecName: Full=Uncharacterized shell protein 3; AltName: Full=Prism uncharacterized shell protein 17; Short=PUSP17; Flags: Precursor [Pinctada margaritifera]CCE46169.1 prism uncharacterized shell protein 17 [Pinctada margaritifera]
MEKSICTSVLVLGLFISSAIGQFCPRDRYEFPPIQCKTHADCGYRSFCEPSGTISRCCTKCPIGTIMVYPRCNWPSPGGCPPFSTCENDPVGLGRFAAVCCSRPYPFYG